MECNHIENSDLILPLRKIFYPKYITLLREKICMKKGNKKKINSNNQNDSYKKKKQIEIL